MKAIAAALAALVLCGCTYQVKRIGDDHYLRADRSWQPGRTTPEDVVAVLGPPDVVRWDSQRIFFVYRSQRRVTTGVLLSFYLYLFKLERTREENGTLLLVFDDADRLIYAATAEPPAHDLAKDLGDDLGTDLGL